MKGKRRGKQEDTTLLPNKRVVAKREIKRDSKKRVEIIRRMIESDRGGRNNV